MGVDNDCGLPDGATGGIISLIYKAGDGPRNLPIYTAVSTNTYKCIQILFGEPSYSFIYPWWIH